MTKRGYFCKKCEHEFEVEQPFKEPLKKKCPQCNKNSLAQDLSGGSYRGSIRQYNTIGSIAEQNSKNLGSYGLQAKEQAVKDDNEDIIRQRNKKLTDAGFKIPEKKESVPIPDKVKKLVQSNDKRAIEKYIREG